MFAFDAKLTQFERSTAKVMAERLRQSQLRIQQYLVTELSGHPNQCSDFAVLLDEALEVPDLTSNFLAIAPYTPLVRCHCKPHAASVSPCVQSV